jgi:hypothetical protein
LPFTFTRPRASREDIEDQLRAIDHFTIDAFLDMAQLSGR